MRELSLVSSAQGAQLRELSSESSAQRAQRDKGNYIELKAAQPPSINSAWPPTYRELS